MQKFHHMHSHIQGPRRRVVLKLGPNPISFARCNADVGAILS